VAVDARYFRPTEVDLLIGDPSKCKSKLGWSPKYDLAALVNDMMKSDVENFQKERMLKEAGYVVKNQFE
jgi:GDPmannose 4,6-dehydratase